MKHGWIIGCIVFLLIVVGLIIYNKNTSTNPSKTSTQVLTPSPTFPFEELTIPYLRSRSYNSSLGSLQTYSKHSNYTIYITSYTSDGLKINGLLTKPTGKVPVGGWPGIVFVHGYIAPNQYQTTERYVDYIDSLARNGFVVFKIDLRGNGNSQGQATGAYYSSDYIIDTLNAYAALQSSGFVNPKKIGLWGHSMAGNVVMRSFTAKPDIPAVVIWAGAVYSYTDLTKYAIHDQSYHPEQQSLDQNIKRQSLTKLYGQPSDTNTFWKQVAPTNYLNDLKGAIQIHHAEDDTVVNIGYSRDLVSLLDKTSVPHEFYTYPIGGHNIGGVSFNQAMERTVAFYKKYLK